MFEICGTQRNGPGHHHQQLDQAPKIAAKAKPGQLTILPRQ